METESLVPSPPAPASGSATTAAASPPRRKTLGQGVLQSTPPALPRKHGSLVPSNSFANFATRGSTSGAALGDLSPSASAPVVGGHNNNNNNSSHNRSPPTSGLPQSSVVTRAAAASTGSKQDQSNKETGSTRIGFGQRHMQKAKEKQIADRAKARYLKLMAHAKRQAALQRIADWWERYKVVKAARRELQTMRNMNQVLNFYILRWIIRARRRRQKNQDFRNWEKTEGAARIRAAISLQHWWRYRLARMLFLRVAKVQRQALEEKRLLERLVRSATIVQSLWRRRKVRQLHRLRLVVLKRRRAVLIVRTIRSHYAFKRAHVTAQQLRDRDYCAATLIARTYRAHLVMSARVQYAFRKEKGLLLEASDLEPEGESSSSSSTQVAGCAC